MRIISQDERIDVPYEQCVLMVEEYGKDWALVAVYPGLMKNGVVRSVCLGVFSSVATAKLELCTIVDKYDAGERTYQVWKKTV